MMNTSLKFQREAILNDQKKPIIITARSGMEINIFDDRWHLLPNKSKGHAIQINWLHNSNMSHEDWQLILDVYIYYARTKAASTACTVVYATKPSFMDGIPQISDLKIKWSGLSTIRKKGINQFFCSLVALGHRSYREYHAFTSTHLNKESKNQLDPRKGALSDIEFDSIAKCINTKLNSINWDEKPDLSYYYSRQFSSVRNCVSSKLMLATVRRGIQISTLKWCDLIPTGNSFNDLVIQTTDEIGTIGANTLQIRMFHAKENNSANPRSHPERYPILLSEELSLTMVQYKKFCLWGISLLFESSQLRVDEVELLSIANNIPMFPDCRLFEQQFNSVESLAMIFTPASMLFHVSDDTVSRSFGSFHVISERSPECVVSNNRIRHTVLTRAAQQGVSAIQLAKITGVTVPAARHYVDMDYESRKLIDNNYIGNEFLKRAYSSNLIQVQEGNDIIFSHNFDPVGSGKDYSTCTHCTNKLGRPLACYGCPNFMPILDADHRAELQLAQHKLEVNKTFLFNPLQINNIKKIEQQIEWVKLTISVCDDILANQVAINAK